MNTWTCFGGFAILVCAVLYGLYCRGIAVSKRIKAVLFVFRSGKDGDKAALDSCTGWVQHVAGFRGNRTWELTLNAQLSKGGGAFSAGQKEAALVKAEPPPSVRKSGIVRGRQVLPALGVHECHREMRSYLDQPASPVEDKRLEV